MVIFTTFYCVDFEDGSSALKADYTIDCNDDARSGWVLFAFVATAVYPIGILALYCCLIFRERHGLRIGKVPPHLNFLVRSYEPECYWFEPVDLVRKLTLATVVAFFFDGEPAQIVITIVLCFALVGVLAYFTPFKDASNDRLAIVSQCSLYYIAFAALLSRFEFAGSDGSGVFSAVLFCVVLVGPVFAVFAVLYAVFSVASAFSLEDTSKLMAAFESCEAQKQDLEDSAGWKSMEADVRANSKKPLKDFQIIWLNRLKECVHLIRIPPGAKIVGVAIAGGKSRRLHKLGSMALIAVKSNRAW